MSYTLVTTAHDFYFALRQVNLSSLYPVALVKAIARADGEPVMNDVPEQLRYMSHTNLLAGGKRAMPAMSFSFGKHVSRTVKQVLKSDPCYLEWFFRNVEARSTDEFVMRLKAWILYYMPELADGLIVGGPLFNGYRHENVLAERESVKA